MVDQSNPGPKTSGDYAARSLLSRALLPNGFHDQIGDAARAKDAVTAAMLKVLEDWGYCRVEPPLVEYEQSFAQLASGHQAPMFRFMDPETQQVMALRSDMTPQVARIALTRFAAEARPIRLSYAGNVVRFKGSTIRPTRQYGQLGAELIGDDSQWSEEEIIGLSLKALQAAKVADLTLDITLPGLGAVLLNPAAMGVHAGLREAFEARDRERLLSFGDTGKLCVELVDAAGPAKTALQRLRTASFPPAARALVDRAGILAELIAQNFPEVAITLDPVERRGFEYKTGIGFALFAGGARSELGRGGRYTIAHSNKGGETAVGFSLYMDRILDVVPTPPRRPRVLVLKGVSPAGVSLPDDAVLVQFFEDLNPDDLNPDDLNPDDVNPLDADKIARAHHCSYILAGSGLRPVPA